MKDKKKLLYLIIGIIFAIIISISGLNIENIYNNTNDVGNYVVITDVGEFPENFSLAEDSNLQILFFDVGQADSILITNKGITMLIDAGSRKNGELLVEYIKQLGVTKIDYLLFVVCYPVHRL